jgi:preprotein translocase subunit SecG
MGFLLGHWHCIVLAVAIVIVLIFQDQKSMNGG